jgi:hypothetical protein
MKKSLLQQKKETELFIQQMLAVIFLGSAVIIGFLYVIEHHEKYMHNYFLIVLAFVIFTFGYYINKTFKNVKAMVKETVQYKSFDDLTEEAKQNILNDVETKKYLAKLRKIKIAQVTEKHVMSHIELNNFIFTPDGRGKKRKLSL